MGPRAPLEGIAPTPGGGTAGRTHRHSFLRRNRPGKQTAPGRGGLLVTQRVRTAAHRGHEIVPRSAVAAGDDRVTRRELTAGVVAARERIPTPPGDLAQELLAGIARRDRFALLAVGADAQRTLTVCVVTGYLEVPDDAGLRKPRDLDFRLGQRRGFQPRWGTNRIGQR